MCVCVCVCVFGVLEGSNSVMCFNIILRVVVVVVTSEVKNEQ